MKERVRQQLSRKKYDVSDFYKETGCAQSIARNSYFEIVTLLVIACNALWIAVDTDHNDSELLINAKLEFQIAEHLFCGYFTCEILIRWLAFQYKVSCLKDAWFMFDSCLVTTMVFETWIM